jgi:hypothetical protein
MSDTPLPRRSRRARRHAPAALHTGVRERVGKGEMMSTPEPSDEAQERLLGTLRPAHAPEQIDTGAAWEAAPPQIATAAANSPTSHAWWRSGVLTGRGRARRTLRGAILGATLLVSLGVAVVAVVVAVVAPAYRSSSSSHTSAYFWLDWPLICKDIRALTFRLLVWREPRNRGFS